MSQEKGMVSEDFLEETGLEQMLEGWVRARQGGKREGDGDDRSGTVNKSLGSGTRTQPAWVAPKEVVRSELTKMGHATHLVSFTAS